MVFVDMIPLPWKQAKNCVQLLLLSLLILPATGLYPALAGACATEAAILKRLQQRLERQPPEQQRSLTNNGDAVLLSAHLNLSKLLLSLWTCIAIGALNLTRFTAVFVPVAAPLVKLTTQQLLTCSAVMASSSSSSSSSSGASSNVHPLFEAASSSLSQAYVTIDRICSTAADAMFIHTAGRGTAATLQEITSDNVLRMLLLQLAAATEQLYYQQQRKLRKASAAAPSTVAAAAAAVDLPEPYHQQVFTALGLPAVDKLRRSNEHLKGAFVRNGQGVISIFTSLSGALMFKQEARVIEPLVRGGGCSGAAVSRRQRSSSSSSRGAVQVPDPVVPAALMRPLLLTSFEACMLDTPLNVISYCSGLMWLLLASSTWLPGSEPPGSSAAAAVAAAAQLQQQLGGAAGVQQVLQLMTQQVGPVMIAAHKRGKLTRDMRSRDDEGKLKGHQRVVTIQGFAGALITLACSGAVHSA
jgi:hypothetical protein